MKPVARILVTIMLACMPIAAQQPPPPRQSNALEAAVIERQEQRVRFENDGTGFREDTAVIHIQTQAGVQAYGQLIFGYTAATEELKVNYVRVRKPSGAVVETPASTAQDFAPEVLQSAPMYNDYRERHVSVEALRPGDTLEYRTTTRILTPLAKGQFWYEYTFPKDQAVTEARLEVEVPKGRELKVKSPKRKYTTSETGDWRTYTWVVQNIVPDRSEENAGEEPEDEPEEIPDVQVTTFSDWQQVASWSATLFGERAVASDAVAKKAAELTRGAGTQTEKAKRLYDFVAREFRYVSLSFGVGRLQPHAAPEVLQAGYGDCKDKHTLLAALLRAVGIPSYPVLIGVGRKLDSDVPSLAQFNHVITAVRLDSGLVWLDTTPEVAPFGFIMPALRGQDAVIAAEDNNGGIHKTPATSPIKSTLTFTLDGKLSETGTLDATIDLKATGDHDVPLRAALRGVSPADWKRFAQVLAVNRNGVGEISDLTVDPLEDTTKPLHLHYRLHQDGYFTVPSAEVSFFPFPGLGFARLRKARGTEPLKIGPATDIVQRIHLQFAANYVLHLPSQVTMKRDYAQYSTSYELKDNALDAVRRLTITVDELPQSRRADVESLRTVVLTTAGQVLSCSIRPASGNAQIAAVPADADPKALHKAATKALQQRDFKSAAELLKRVVTAEPDNDSAWDELGRAYMGVSDHTAAVQAFQKQVEVNPYHKSAYDHLGSELQQQGKNEEAIAAFRKQLENVPLDRFARKNLGLLLLQLKRDQEAITELENAASVPPGDPEVDMALAQACARVGNAEKARPILMRLVGSASSLPGDDIYSVALTDTVDLDRTLHDARGILDNVGDDFDSGMYADGTADASSAMQFVALAWARIGWADFLNGQTLEGLRFLNAAWTLSQSGTVANRIARVYEKAGQISNAKRFLALAVAAGGIEVESSRARLLKMDPSGADDALARARTDLAQMSSIHVSKLSAKSGTAEFSLLFDGSDKPDRADYRSGDIDSLSAQNAILNVSYPVLFPEVSSVKVVRRATLSCVSSGCVVVLKPPAPFGQAAQ